MGSEIHSEIKCVVAKYVKKSYSQVSAFHKSWKSSSSYFIDDKKRKKKDKEALFNPFIILAGTILSARELSVLFLLPLVWWSWGTNQ